MNISLSRWDLNYSIRLAQRSIRGAWTLTYYMGPHFSLLMMVGKRWTLQDLGQLSAPCSLPVSPWGSFNGVFCPISWFLHSKRFVTQGGGREVIQKFGRRDRNNSYVNKPRCIHFRVRGLRSCYPTYQSRLSKLPGSWTKNPLLVHYRHMGVVDL